MIRHSDKATIVEILQTQTINTVAIKFNTSEPLVHLWLRKWNTSVKQIRDEFREKVIVENLDLSNEQLAKLLNVAVNHASRIRNELNAPFMRFSIYDEEDKFLIVELLKTLPARVVAEKFDISYSTLTNTLRRWQVYVPKIKRDFRIEYMSNNPGKSVKWLADYFGCSAATVYNLKNEIKDM